MENSAANKSVFKPAVINVGDELMYGERNNDNQRWLLNHLWLQGIPAVCAMSLPDDINVIANWIKNLKETHHFPIIVSGGHFIGTHDDFTREAIAKGLGRDFVPHDVCYEILSKKYGSDFTPERKRMTLLPKGSTLIANPIGAPGFHVDGVYAFPGFSTMLKPMCTQILSEVLQQHSSVPLLVMSAAHEFILPCAEGLVAKDVEIYALSNPAVKVGIYPSSANFGKEVKVRIRYNAEIHATERLAWDALHKKLLEKVANIPNIKE